MAKVENIKMINPLDGVGLDLYWGDVPDYVKEYCIYRADVLGDNPTWFKIGTTDYTFFRDNNYNENEGYWYTITYIDEYGEESSKSEPVYYNIRDLYAWNHYVWNKATVAKTKVLFDYNAERVGIFLTKRAGHRCAECYDHQQSEADENCPVCHGSGFTDGGFYRFQIDGEDPKVRMYNAGETVDFVPFGKLIVNTPTALGICLPILRTSDFIYRYDNPAGEQIVYKVQQTYIKAFNQFVTFQRYDLDEKGEDDFKDMGGEQYL